METVTVEAPYKILFDEFEVISIVAEPTLNYTIPLPFSTLKNKQIEQIRIFDKLESALPFFNGESFADQVHFQFAPKTPIQRWFP
ncbi:MAG: hypothetical protein Q7J27_08635, partial [Syntrophales bacterium]|nr:hypothetical protein [Syntrophales bacterium]